MQVRAAVAWQAGQPLSLETVELEGPRAGEVLVEIKATGICHTDEYTLSGADPEGLFPTVLGHEAVGALPLAHVVIGRGQALHALAEHPGHEQRVVADVSSDRDLPLGSKMRGVIVPGGLRLQQQIHDALQSRHRHAGWKQVLRAREPGEEVGQVTGRRVVTHGQIVEARLDRAIEESPELHERNDNKSHGEAVACSRVPP